VAILGGLGNSMAAVAAGFILGILESFSIWVMPTAYKDAIAISLLLAMLFLRPSGLFGNREAFKLKDSDADRTTPSYPHPFLRRCQRSSS